MNQSSMIFFENIVDWYPSPTHVGLQQPAYQDKSFDDKKIDISLSQDGQTVKIDGYTYYRTRK